MRLVHYRSTRNGEIVAAKCSVFVLARCDASAKDKGNSLRRLAECRDPGIGVGRIVSNRGWPCGTPCLVLDRWHTIVHHMRVAVPRAPDQDRSAAANYIARLATRLAGILDLPVITGKRLIAANRRQCVAQPARFGKAVARDRRECLRPGRTIALFDEQCLEPVFVIVVVRPRKTVAVKEPDLAMPRRMRRVIPIFGTPPDGAPCRRLAPIRLAQHRVDADSDSRRLHDRGTYETASGT